MESLDPITQAAESIVTFFGKGGINDTAETPRRFAKFLKEFRDVQPFNLTVFENDGTDQMVVVSGIPFYSLCEHHLVPFFGRGAIGYVPDGKIIGLSKLPRILQQAAAGLRTQERVAKEVGDILERALAPKGIAVLLRARHLCMEMRGIRSVGSVTDTADVRGVFRDQDSARMEFYKIAGEKNGQPI